MSTLYHESFPEVPGIYKIACIPTGKFYIGSSVNLWKRRKDHRHCLNQGIHKNPKLQAAWNKYGKEAFIFEILELVLIPEMLTAREQHWIDTLKPFGKNGFNLVHIAGSNLGMKHTPEARAKMSEAQRGKPGKRLGKKASPETIERLRASHLGKTQSEEAKHKLSLLYKGKKQFSAETRERIRATKLGHEVSPEARARISASKTGHTYTPEVYAGRMKSLIVIAPDGTEHVIHGIKQFCKKHNLNASHLLQVAKGNERHHKGWKARFPD